MAKGKNCPNCGAVIDYDYDRCQYCGTPYDLPKEKTLVDVKTIIERPAPLGTAICKG